MVEEIASKKKGFPYRLKNLRKMLPRTSSTSKSKSPVRTTKSYEEIFLQISPSLTNSEQDKPKEVLHRGNVHVYHHYQYQRAKNTSKFQVAEVSGGSSSSTSSRHESYKNLKSSRIIRYSGGSDDRERFIYEYDNSVKEAKNVERSSSWHYSTDSVTSRPFRNTYDYYPYSGRTWPLDGRSQREYISPSTNKGVTEQSMDADGLTGSYKDYNFHRPITTSSAAPTMTTMTSSISIDEKNGMAKEQIDRDLLIPNILRSGDIIKPSLGKSPHSEMENKSSTKVDGGNVDFSSRGIPNLLSRHQNIEISQVSPEIHSVTLQEPESLYLKSSTAAISTTPTAATIKTSTSIKPTTSVEPVIINKNQQEETNPEFFKVENLNQYNSTTVQEDEAIVTIETAEMTQNKEKGGDVENGKQVHFNLSAGNIVVQDSRDHDSKESKPINTLGKFEENGFILDQNDEQWNMGYSSLMEETKNPSIDSFSILNNDKGYLVPEGESSSNFGEWASEWPSLLDYPHEGLVQTSDMARARRKRVSLCDTSYQGETKRVLVELPIPFGDVIYLMTYLYEYILAKWGRMSSSKVRWLATSLSMKNLVSSTNKL